MYNLTFSVGNTTINKVAKSESDVKRIVFIYASGNTSHKNKLIADVLNIKEVEIDKKAEEMFEPLKNHISEEKPDEQVVNKIIKKSKKSK